MLRRTVRPTLRGPLHRSPAEPRHDTDRLILDHVYDHETNHRDHVFFTQPPGGGAVQDHTWGQAVGEARRVATHLPGLGLPRGARVGNLSTNCAHFIMAALDREAEGRVRRSVASRWKEPCLRDGSRQIVCGSLRLV